MFIKKKRVLNAIYIIFSIIAVFLFTESKENKEKITALLGLLFFGGGGIVYNILVNEESGSLAKNIAGMFGCLIFLIMCFYILPFNHLFDNSWRYNSTLGWIIGVIGILFFGFGLLRFTINLLKRDDKD